MAKQKTAGVIVIGNEILSGRTQDQNLAYIGTRLNVQGVRVMEAAFILDHEATIVEKVNDFRIRYDYVFTTGGIGPTHDDITAESMAKAFGVGFDFHEDAVSLLRAHYKPEDLNEARLRMAKMPVGARLIPNPVSGAPSFAIENVYVLAGVPRIMQAMLDGAIAHEIRGGDPMMSITVSSFVTEGSMAIELACIQNNFPEIEIGSYPFFKDGKFGTSLVLRGFDVGTLERAASEVSDLLSSKGGDPLREI